ncbi:hypothetical protein PHYBLDRAFT_153416 [Phycomyces blakesleeanus NRRL 1555(-)]|uniref:SWIM-type domain-containing protein n=1 Tax=Phycomyces blakesleeanus (strain ATCC 8743b / DSM 1359 / FGSC 10004 / NBRC 33097 / NRRL 1555) TaxID=763407 RepID=A0A162N3N2_PHYB8|nr:hypothetical protein PHYBLDRAFT_153416 [Phycomyces blakesleeanus NRRL 1555(-)]OAD65514.1 hypothetical protein PHYBLDRAFT_153416 [Phycomyces blakesleeanus NRRL 1555(-)]|eukprot:XP_018283554.1 hypothetical protein PHYBLDRAFT_153416 [Phycomyces blakesleeanus NRRL 1555(-)]
MVFIGKPLENPLKVKTVVYLCDHAEKPQVKKTSQSAKKCVKTIKSIKIGCSASIYKHIMTDGTVCIKYNWQHPNHDPFKIEEISPSRLPDELKQWVEELVSQNMDWKSIKNMLRMSDDRLLELEQAVHKNGPFLILWVSEWQKEFLENSEEWYIDSTHKTSKSFNTVAGKGPEDCFLFTIVVQNPITNKESLVCFFIADYEYTSTLSEYPIEIGAIEEVFGNSVNILLCHWHIKRAWEVNVKKHIKVQNSTHASNIARNSIHAAATFYTNNLIESYYNQLKTFYLGHARSLRVDRLIYLLAKVLTLDYRQKNIKIYTAMEMVEKLSDTIFTCRSFTVDFVIYNIELQNNFLQNCTCPDTSKLCKHIFLINHMLDITYSLCQSLSSSSAVHVSNTDTKPVVDTSLLSDEIKADIMKYCQLYSVELDSKIAEYKRMPKDMSQFLDTLKFAYNKLKEYSSFSQSLLLQDAVNPVFLSPDVGAQG